MSPKQREALIAGVALAALVASVEAAAAQGEPRTSETLKSESTGPQDPRSTGSVGRSSESLSDKLDSTGGVIPPPGTPGGDRTIEPK